jgi:branched-chain amino acid transport system permease protein
LLNKTKLGKQINAASSDMEMADALGINVPLLFTTVFVLGSAAAGIAGVLLTLKLSLVPPLGLEYLIYAFAVVVIGGLGSYKGSIYGALIVGVCYSFGILLIPAFAMVFVFALLLLTLLIRPRGLFGVVEEIRAPAVAVGKKIVAQFSFFSGKLSSNTLIRAGGLLLVLFVILLPILAPGFWVVFVTEVLILILLATSLNMLVGAGMLSLAHAAFFGTGAYITSLVLIHITNSLIFALVGSVLMAAFFAFIIGLLSLRHVEIYFALLTLAFAQFVYTVVFKWSSLTGGDDGLMGIPFPSLNFLGLTRDVFVPDTSEKYLYLVLVIVLFGLLALRMIMKSPFGQILQGIRENTERISFVGLNPKKYKLAAFVLAGSFAGLAGAVFAPFEMVVSPYAAHWTKSIDPIFMCIIGGVNTTLGPGVGAVIYIFFKDWLSSLMEYWRIWFGLMLIVIAIGFPRGLIGYLQIGLSNALARNPKS